MSTFDDLNKAWERNRLEEEAAAQRQKKIELQRYDDYMETLNRLERDRRRRDRKLSGTRKSPPITAPHKGREKSSQKMSRADERAMVITFVLAMVVAIGYLLYGGIALGYALLYGFIIGAFVGYLWKFVWGVIIIGVMLWMIGTFL
jgi:hypothetical protein